MDRDQGDHESQRPNPYGRLGEGARRCVLSFLAVGFFDINSGVGPILIACKVMRLILSPISIGVVAFFLS